MLKRARILFWNEMIIFTDKQIHFENQLELESQMFRFNCQTIDEIKELFWFEYKMTIVLDYKKKIDGKNI